MSDNLLLFSGGFDSTLVALMRKDKGERTHALTIDDDGRPQSEKRAASLLAEQIEFESWSVTRIDGFGTNPCAEAGRFGSSLEGLLNPA